MGVLSHYFINMFCGYAQFKEKGNEVQFVYSSS